jgi:hypothetical protein
MTKTLKGEVEFVVGEQTYTLVYDYEALEMIEEAADKPISEVLAEAQRKTLRMKQLKLFLWAALQRHHEGMTQKEAADIALAAGIGVTQLKVSEAFIRAFPPREEAKAPADPQEPEPEAGASLITTSDGMDTDSVLTPSSFAQHPDV